MKKFNTENLWPWAIMLALYLATVAFRPLLPIDETRYMTVAWEMRLHEGWLAPLTMNFEPYHHKPPLLFWLINAFWSVFGINRWAGLIPIALASLSVIFLTTQLAKKLISAEDQNNTRLFFLTMGGVPFLIYSTMVMFDMTMTVFVLLSLLCLLNFAQKNQRRYIFLLSFCLGLGVLTKGPVAYLYVLCPMLLAPLWVPNFSRPWSWYGHALLAVLLSLIPVAVWIIPVLAKADNNFAFWLLWEQTAGRVTGNYGESHSRPVYFYLPLLLVLFSPWMFFPEFWRSLKCIDKKSMAIRFLACWLVPVFICFSLIGGKQPHYLLPLFPGIIIFISILLKETNTRYLQRTAIALIAVIVIGQAIAAQTYFKNYDLTRIASYVGNHKNIPWSYVRNYQGEIGFLGKINMPIDDINSENLNDWFAGHPDGKAMIRYNDLSEVQTYRMEFSMPYRGKNLGIFSKP